MVFLSYSSPSEGLFVGALQGLLLAGVIGVISLVRKKKNDGKKDENQISQIEDSKKDEVK